MAIFQRLAGIERGEAHPADGTTDWKSIVSRNTKWSGAVRFNIIVAAL
jgi:hypothetical protein